ncbi:MAG TPA: redoxin domain-containing protein [Opitutaceae bacterium]|jgi:peroxiredoxin
MPLPVGAQAPEFSLKSKTADGYKDVRLSEILTRKRALLLFFPFAFTGTCTAEMCDVSNGLSGYGSLEAEVIGISVDSPFALDAWARQEKITVTLASDLNKTVSRAYGVLIAHAAGIGDMSARAAFVVGRDSKILYAEQTPTPKDLPNFAAIKAALSH